MIRKIFNKFTLKFFFLVVLIAAAIAVPYLVFAAPIEISTCQGLQDMSLDVTADYELTADIDCTYDTQDPGGALYNGGAGFLPILDFDGTLNGNNHTITGLYINRPTEDNVGLFSTVTLAQESHVSNIGFIDADITGDDRVGVLFGFQLGGGSITNVSTTGTVSGTSRVGGLVGYGEGTITDAYSSATITCIEGFCGGLIGVTSRPSTGLYATGDVTMTGTNPAFFGKVGGLVGEAGWSLTDCYATGTVTGWAYVGGLVGWQTAGPVTNSYATGDVFADNTAGGLYGELDGDVSTSYATGNVTLSGVSEAGGGLVGMLTNSADVTNTYARGNVTGSAYIGGLIGLKIGNVVNSYATGLVTATSNKGALVGASFGGTVSYGYWDKDTTGMTTSVGSDPSYGKTTSEMKTQATFETWDFSTIWWIDSTQTINDGYPYLLLGSTPPPDPTDPPASTPTPTSAPGDPPPVAGGCDLPSPATAPVLYQAIRTGNKVKLWFTPVNANSDGYVIIYGYEPGDERFGVIFGQGFSPGALVYEIGHLDPKQKYTFKIQAKNHCASGPWSNYISVAALGSGGPPTEPTSSPVATNIPSRTTLPSVSPTPTSTPTLTPSPTPLLPLNESQTATPSAELTNDSNQANDSGIPGFPITADSDTTTDATDGSIIETIIENAPQITQTGTAVGVRVVAVVVSLEVAKTAFVVAKSLYTVYSQSPRHSILLPIDFIGGVGFGFWQMIIGFFGPLFGFLRRKTDSGKVFDGLTGKPVSGAHVVFFSASGNLKTAFTDKFGQYEVKPRPDKYSLRVDHHLYDFPSKLVVVRQAFSFSRVYLPGEKIEVKTEGEVINYLAIPIDPLKLKAGLLALLVKVWHLVTFVFSKLALVFEVGLFLVSGVAAFTNPDIIYKAFFVFIASFVIFDLGGRIITSPSINKK